MCCTGTGFKPSVVAQRELAVPWRLSLDRSAAAALVDVCRDVATCWCFASAQALCSSLGRRSVLCLGGRSMCFGCCHAASALLLLGLRLCNNAYVTTTCQLVTAIILDSITNTLAYTHTHTDQQGSQRVLSRG